MTRPGTIPGPAAGLAFGSTLLHGNTKRHGGGGHAAHAAHAADGRSVREPPPPLTPPPPPLTPLHRGEISEMGLQYNYGGATTGAMALSLLLEGPAGQLTVWLRDGLGLAQHAIALTITLGAGTLTLAPTPTPTPTPTLALALTLTLR